MRLVGDGLENPANARALLDAASLYGIPCRFRDSRGLARTWRGQLPTVDDVAGPIVAVDNTPDATSVFTAAHARYGESIVVGNERRGIRPDLLRAATRRVVIPTPGPEINTLNVAAAAAVALYYLLTAEGRRGPRTPRPESDRPAVLLLGPGDHVEAGSTLRSAAALGWRTVGLDDREKVWFGTPRPVRAEGRAAARSHRNPLRVVPTGTAGAAGFDRVVVAGVRVEGPPLHRTRLTGRGTLLVIPDEGAVRYQEGTEYARVELPGPDPAYRYRLIASIVLAEAARQLGVLRPRRRPARYRYESALAARQSEADLVTAAELDAY